MSARKLVEALGGRWHGHYGMAGCPAHPDRSPSLKITDFDNGEVGVHCFGGCGWRDVKDQLRRDGLLPPRTHRAPRPELALDAGGRGRREAERRAEERRRSEAARRIWRDARAVAGTLAEVYLRSRGITIPIPPSIRYAPNLRHRPTGMVLPALIAGIQGPDGRVTGVLRTFLRVDGRAKAPFTNARMMLGRAAGGAVRLAAAGPELAVAEGLETALSVMQATGIPTWAALSTSGMRAVILPPQVREVILCPDGDEPGEEAAQEAARRFMIEGRRVRVAHSPCDKDFNDVLAAIEGPAA